MNIKLKRRYPNSRTEDITDAFSRGFEVGYNAGYKDAEKHYQEECRQLRNYLSAILDRGETPEDSGSKADRG